jgi:LuxR family transcriptional regulator, maltose regulon positive regulatory protein
VTSSGNSPSEPTPSPSSWGSRVVTAYALEAVARDRLGDRDAAERALERALDLAEPDEVLTLFLLSPPPT